MSPTKNISRSHSRDRSRTPPSAKGSHSKSPRLKDNRDTKKSISHSKKGSKNKEKKPKRDATPPRKYTEGTPPPKRDNKSDRSSLTPPKSYKRSDKSVTPSTSSKYKNNSPGTPPRKRKDNSLTPPRCYARTCSSSSSKSRSRSHTPKRKVLQSPKSKDSRSCSHSSGRSSQSSRSSRSKSKRRNNRMSKHKSRTKSRSRHTSISRTKSRRKSKSRGRRSQSSNDSKSRSGSRCPVPRSQSRTPSEDERRGQFTVADRKRFWKLHKKTQEEKDRDRSPPKEVKPPPGAVESTQVDDIEYGDPPEVEGVNYAELLPHIDQVLPGSSSSKSRATPLPIKNDGSFLEMFKKMQEQTKKVEEKKPEIKKPLFPFIGKRRGGRVLKTGLVKKAKAIDEQTLDSTPKDAWSLYMQEVKKYRETSCEEERKTRPLVK